MIRNAYLSDVDAITRLINAAFVVERFFIDGDRTNEAEVKSLMAQGTFLLKEDERGVAACVYVKAMGDRGYMGLLSVGPSRQRSGLGRLMVAAAEQWCMNAGCRVLDLQVVNLREELPVFYGKLGYHVTGEAPFPEEAHPKMLKPCHFLKMSKELVR